MRSLSLQQADDGCEVGRMIQLANVQPTVTEAGRKGKCRKFSDESDEAVQQLSTSSFCLPSFQK
jgi:hypothetical protein